MFARWRYIDAMRDARYPGFAVPDRNYFDLGASYSVNSGPLRGLTARVGLENLFEEGPPICPSAKQASTDPSQYDVPGRRYFLRLQYRLQRHRPGL